MGITFSPGSRPRPPPPIGQTLSRCRCELAGCLIVLVVVAVVVVVGKVGWRQLPMSVTSEMKEIRSKLGQGYVRCYIRLTFV